MEKKYIIILSGVSDAGKSSTLKKVAEALGLQKEGRGVSDVHASGELEGGVVVTCDTDGDDNETVKDNVKNGIEMGASIILTAIHPGSRMASKLRNGYPGYEVIEIGKLKVGDKKKNENISNLLAPIWEKVNCDYMDVIIKLVNELIKNG